MLLAVAAARRRRSRKTVGALHHPVLSHRAAGPVWRLIPGRRSCAGRKLRASLRTAKISRARAGARLRRLEILRTAWRVLSGLILSRTATRRTRRRFGMVHSFRSRSHRRHPAISEVFPRSPILRWIEIRRTTAARRPAGTGIAAIATGTMRPVVTLRRGILLTAAASIAMRNAIGPPRLRAVVALALAGGAQFIWRQFAVAVAVEPAERFGGMGELLGVDGAVVVCIERSEKAGHLALAIASGPRAGFARRAAGRTIGGSILSAECPCRKGERGCGDECGCGSHKFVVVEGFAAGAARGFSASTPRSRAFVFSRAVIRHSQELILHCAWRSTAWGESRIRSYHTVSSAPSPSSTVLG